MGEYAGSHKKEDKEELERRINFLLKSVRLRKSVVENHTIKKPLKNYVKDEQ